MRTPARQPVLSMTCVSLYSLVGVVVSPWLAGWLVPQPVHQLRLTTSGNSKLTARVALQHDPAEKEQEKVVVAGKHAG